MSHIHIVLYQPEIPPNTGNIIRLAANSGMTLHLIEPLGFDFEDKQLRRAGLDYREWADVTRYASFAAFLETHKNKRLFFCSTKGSMNYSQPNYQPGDTFVFGPETRGLPSEILNAAPRDNVIRIPMVAESRSLNLANAVGIICFEAWRQLKFIGS